MNHDDYPNFRSYEPPVKKRVMFNIYLMLFIAIIVTMIVGVYAGRQLAKQQEQEAQAPSPATQMSPDDPRIIRPENRSEIGADESFKAQAPVNAPPILDVRSFENAVIAAAKKATPAVVTIQVSGTVYYSFRDPFMRMLYGRRPMQKPISGMGSGVIIGADGIIITNDHVINITNGNRDLRDTRLDIEVVLSEGRTFKAKVIRNFPIQDIAILKIEAENLPFIEIGSSSNIQPGQTVLAIGNPFGDALTGGLLGGEATVTRGIISATRRNLTIPGEHVTRYYRNMLQTDASINEGNSGGALVDLNGRLVGINTAIFSPNHSGSVGIGFAYPADRVRLILDHVNEDGDIGNWYTGIAVQELNPNISSSLEYEGNGGVLVTAVEEGSPGEKAGIKRGDIIVKVNGFTMTSTEEIRSMFEGAIPGETFTLNVYRAGKFSDCSLKLGMQ